MNHRLTSWTGSESDRRQQGDCRAPSRPSEPLDQFVIEAGKPAQGKKLSWKWWRRITTQKVTRLPWFESQEGCYLIFRLNGFLLKIHESYVTKEKIHD